MNCSPVLPARSLKDGELKEQASSLQQELTESPLSFLGFFLLYII